MNPTEERQTSSTEADVTAVADTQDEMNYEEMVAFYDASMRHLSEGEIVTGKVIDVTNNHVIIDVGYKSEGLVPISEFPKKDGKVGVTIGEDVDVLAGDDSAGEVRQGALETALGAESDIDVRSEIEAALAVGARSR